VFSWWGVVSAAFWVPSGLLTIASVPLIGMAMQVAVNCAANAVLTFLVFWLVFKSKMKAFVAPTLFVCLFVCQQRDVDVNKHCCLLYTDRVFLSFTSVKHEASSLSEKRDFAVCLACYF
jgi:hypothetical protein